MTEVNTQYTQKTTAILTHQRDVILFDFLARGLALTHRPFDAVELTRAKLDISKIPLLLVMMERQCDAKIQQKLVDYVHAGGRLILVGRMCLEDFDHQPCTILKDALGIKQINGGQPFASDTINVFNYKDTPVSFLEIYAGEFDEVFAARENGEVAGFVKAFGKGQVMIFGAALAANTLDDLDIFKQMALKLGCQPLFSPSEWADIRVSNGADGNFLFINNYQDDPLETVIQSAGETLFGGHQVRLPARSGAMLPLEWHVREGILLHYATSEITDILNDGTTLFLKTLQAEFYAEITVSGYQCENAIMTEDADGTQRACLHGMDGKITLRYNHPHE